jgi:uncharacterized protein
VPRRSSPASTARYAAIVAVLVVAAAAAILVACPPAQRQPEAGAASQAGPREPEGQPAPESHPSTEAQSTRPAQRPAPATAVPSTAMPAVAARGAAGIPPERPHPEIHGMLSVIIDDAGYSLEDLKAFLDLPIPLTIAVLPNLPHSAEAARRVRAAGKTLILHCPMEPEGGEDPGPGALFTGQSSQEVARRLDAMFATVPGAVGMNNHMGSKATADPVLMEAVLGYLRDHGLLYVDSRTTAQTEGPRIAAALGVRFTQRDVFIDAGTTESEIAASFESGVELAAARGSAVLIGHVHNRGVAAILRAMNGRLEARGARFAGLDEVMRDREGRAAR